MKRVIAALLVSTLVFAGCSGDEGEADADPTPEVEPDPEPEPEPADTRPRSPLTGEALEPELLERPPMIVKIDNAPAARPQTALEVADVVIEEVVEAGVTRFMAIFHSEVPDDVGPTRSARPVDAQLITAFGRAGFVYSGARAEVRELLAGTPAIRISEGGPGFYRQSGRRAPHNLFNRLPEALATVEEREPDPLRGPDWLFADEAPPGAVECPPATADGEATTTPCADPGAEVEVRMSSGFRTGWTYDEAAGVYRRLQNGERFLVTGPDSIGAANVVVLATEHYLGSNNCHGNRCPETDATTDGARAIVLRDGKRYEGTWRKPTPEAHIELFTETGQRFPLKPGSTWIMLPSAANMPAPIG